MPTGAQVDNSNESRAHSGQNLYNQSIDRQIAKPSLETSFSLAYKRSSLFIIYPE